LGFGIKLESAGPGVREVYRGLGLWEPDISHLFALRYSPILEGTSSLTWSQ
jgi:hypothetical protein